MEAEFLTGCSIHDKADRLLLPRENHLYGWLLSTSTITHTKMNIGKSLPPLPGAQYDRPSTAKRLRLSKDLPPVQQPQYDMSTSSESSETWAADDFTSWSGSDTTFDDRHSSEAELWDSYFWEHEKDGLLQPFQQVGQTPVLIRSQGSALSSYNRNFASSNLSGLNINECPAEPAELHRSDALRTPRRTQKAVPQKSYSVFPPLPPLPPKAYDSAHKSWPLHDPEPKTPRPALRSRAFTSPANCKPLAPSNLSTCSTLDDHDSPAHSTTSSASGLYMRSPPVSPGFEPLMSLLEKSYFDDDSDDEETGLVALATRLHIRSSSANSPPTSTKEKTVYSQKSRRNLKWSGDSFKGIFGKKRSFCVV